MAEICNNDSYTQSRSHTKGIEWGWGIGERQR